MNHSVAAPLWYFIISTLALVWGAGCATMIAGWTAFLFWKERHKRRKP